MKEEKKSIDEILIHLGENREEYYSAISPPILQSSNFRFKDIDDFRTKILDEEKQHVYTRGNNPTVKILRAKLAALEGAEDALVVGSGASAVTAAIMPFVRAGDHIICVEKPYSWTAKLLVDFLPKFGVETTFVDGRIPENISKALRVNTKLLFLESPNSLTFELQDLEWCGKFAQENKLISIIDNSYASPFYQRPIDWGIDLVVHSATKYLNGHSDVVAGVILGKKSLIQEIFHSTYMTFGTIISPNDAWLMLRGLRTFPLRMTQSDNTAKKLVEYLSNHPKVKRVFYPLHPTFPQYALAKKQMTGCGGLFTIELDVHQKIQIETFVKHIQRFLLAVSWGGYESLMIPSLVFHDMPGRPDSLIPWTFIRFYCGLESYEYLVEDLDKALDKI